MELSEFDEWDIESYFRIDERIQRIVNDIDRYTEEFYNQTFLTRTDWNGYEGSVVAFRLEHDVISFLDIIEKMKKRIERLSKKKKYFTDYLDSLVPEEKEYLVNKYTQEDISRRMQQEDFNLLEEIREIETAICYMYGFPVPEHAIRIDNEFLEDDFSGIAAMLGV